MQRPRFLLTGALVLVTAGMVGLAYLIAWNPVVHAYLYFLERPTGAKAQRMLAGSAGMGKLKEVHVLLANGAQATQLAPDGQSPLHHACRSGTAVVVETLLKQPGADPNATGKGVAPPLLQALTREGQRDTLDIVRLLLAAGADPNGRDPGRWVMSIGSGRPFRSTDQTALIRAVATGKQDCAELLLGSGADVNARDDRGKTALIWWAIIPARDPSWAELGRTLLRAGAKRGTRDANGWTVMDWAQRQRNNDQLQVLLEARTPGMGPGLE
jgi:ankyrin repeat protein